MEDAWKDRDGGVASLRREGSNVGEFPLSSLGQASGICPGVAAGLEAGNMGGCRLDTVGVHRFLVEASLALEQAGFGVLLPS